MYCGISNVEAVGSSHSLNMESIAIRTVVACSEYLLGYNMDIDGKPAPGEESKYNDGLQNMMMEYKTHLYCYIVI